MSGSILIKYFVLITGQMHLIPGGVITLTKGDQYEGRGKTSRTNTPQCFVD